MILRSLARCVLEIFVMVRDFITVSILTASHKRKTGGNTSHLIDESDLVTAFPRMAVSKNNSKGAIEVLTTRAMEGLTSNCQKNCQKLIVKDPVRHVTETA